MPTAELFRILQDVFVPERPAVHCSRKVDVSRASKTSTTHPQSRQAAESPILVQQQTNHAGRLVLLAGAQAVLQGAPLDCSSGTHCSAAWSMASASCLPPSQTDKTDQVKPPDSGHPRLTQKKTNEFRNNAAPGRGQKQR